MLIRVMPSGIVMAVSNEQRLNAEGPMLVTLAGMVISANPQEQNAVFPILVTPSGMEIAVRLEQ